MKAADFVADIDAAKHVYRETLLKLARGEGIDPDELQQILSDAGKTRSQMRIDLTRAEEHLERIRDRAKLASLERETESLAAELKAIDQERAALTKDYRDKDWELAEKWHATELLRNQKWAERRELAFQLAHT